MKKIERFLSETGAIITIALVIVWVFWALQLGGPLKSYISEEIEYQKTRNAEQEFQTQKELTFLAKKLTDKVEALGESYTPKNYFNDLRTLYLKAAEGRLTVTPYHTSLIQQVVRENQGKEIITQAEIEIEANKFAEWNKDQISHRDEFIAEAKTLTLAQVKSWTIAFIFLIIPFYLIRMNQRRGILETILADKTRLALAITFWPVYLTRYPYNVVREIRVEAELRRFKDL